jgi:hypothetical protein
MGARPGKHIIRNNVATHETLAFTGGANVVRLLPNIDYSDPASPQWTPYRHSLEEGHYGDWIRRYDAVRNFGEQNPVTFITRDPGDIHAPPVEALPSQVVYRAI